MMFLLSLLSLACGMDQQYAIDWEQKMQAGQQQLPSHEKILDSQIREILRTIPLNISQEADEKKFRQRLVNDFPLFKAKTLERLEKDPDFRMYLSEYRKILFLNSLLSLLQSIENDKDLFTYPLFGAKTNNQSYGLSFFQQYASQLLQKKGTLEPFIREALKAGTVLEIGSGHAFLPLLLFSEMSSAQFQQWTVTDINETFKPYYGALYDLMMSLDPELAKKFHFESLDITKETAQKANFMLCLNVLHYISPQDLSQSVKNIYGALEQNGKALIMVHSENFMYGETIQGKRPPHPYSLFVRKKNDNEYRWAIEGETIPGKKVSTTEETAPIGFIEKEFKELLEKHGLKIEAFKKLDSEFNEIKYPPIINDLINLLHTISDKNSQDYKNVLKDIEKIKPHESFFMARVSKQQ